MADVLVVDDDGAMRELLRELLEEEGHHVSVAGDGREALDTLRAAAQRFLVLLDVYMPRMDGLELLSFVARDAALRSNHGYIIVTAAAQVGSKGVLSLPSDPEITALLIPVMHKPFDLDELIARVREAIGRL